MAQSGRSTEKDADRTLGTQLRERRRALGLTQQGLAELAGCGADFVYDLERGKPTVRLDKLLPVAAALGLELKLVPREGTFTTEPGEWLETKR